MTLTFDLLTSESIDVLLGYWATHILSFNQIEPVELELLRSQGNYAIWSCDLDLSPFDLKINRRLSEV